MAGGIVPLHDRFVKCNSDSRYYRYYERFGLVVERPWPQTHICDNVGQPTQNEIAMSRLTIDITSQQHQNLKAMAALQGKTIKQYALERLFPGDASGEQAWRELQTLLGERIAQGLDGQTSPLSIGAIVDEELGSDADA